MSINSKSAHRGLTLVEILVALVMTLIVLGSMMFAFRYASTEIARGRAVMELSNRIRTAENLLRSDTEGVTVDVRPWAITASPNGYFELVEGGRYDNTGTIMGDVDDILAMTVRSEDRPFRGRFNGEIIESDVAEVVWWTSIDDVDGDGQFENGQFDYDDTITLHRRVLLIRPDLVSLLPIPAANPADVQEYFLLNDVSARVENGQMVPNSLGDLGRRENRFAHRQSGRYPFEMWLGNPGPATAPDDLGLLSFQMSEENLRPYLASDPELLAKAGDDVVLTDVLGFDLRVFSPDAQILEQGGVALEPSDLNYTGTPQGSGAYVNLGDSDRLLNNNLREHQFAFEPTLKSQLSYSMLGSEFVVYDTFTSAYEVDGPARDGIDNSLTGQPNGAVDDSEERVTLPPYPQRLFGMKTILRVVERNSKQVRQTEIISSFLPQ